MNWQRTFYMKTIQLTFKIKDIRMDIEWYEFEKLLITLQGKIELIEEIQRQKGETFNIFSILNMERHEVKTHSALMYDLINPKGSHSQGNKYLELFIDRVLGEKEFDFTNVNVKREDPTDDGRRIDFTIENSNYFIAIEMKIDAGDQDKQLMDYMTHANNTKKKSKLYYLTLDGKEASEKSTNGEAFDYIRLSFTLEILDWIEACIEKSATLPIIRESLIQYANIIRKITGQTTQEVTMEVVKIIDNPKIAQAATEMAQNLGYVWALKEAEFWHTLWSQFNKEESKKSWVLHDDFETLYDESDKLLSVQEIAHRIDSGRASKDILFGFAFYNDVSKVNLKIYQYNSTGLCYQLENLNNVSLDIDTMGKSIGITKKFGKYRWGESKINLKFYGYGKGDVPTYELFNDNEMDKFVVLVANEIRKHLNGIDKAIKDIS